MTELELAWVAGFFDGEGCVSLVWARNAKLRHPSPCLAVSLANTDLRAISVLQGAFPTRLRSYVPRRAGQGVYQRVYEWRLAGAAAARFLSAIRPYSVVKAAQIDIALQFASERQGSGRRRTAEQVEKDKHYADALKRLKVVA